MGRSYPEQVVKLIWGETAARCCNPMCRKLLILPASSGDRAKPIGKIAHIIAHGKTGPRADPSYPEHLLNSLENLLLLCPTCHDKVDAQALAYPIATLRQWKNDHLDWVETELSRGMSELSFEELQLACEGLVAADSFRGELTIIPPKEKMDRNELGPSSHRYIAMGMAAAHDVQQFLTMMEQTAPNFSIRLVAGLRMRYNDCYREGYRGDKLFNAMICLLDRPTMEMKMANLALVSYFFELCDIFKK